MTRSDVTIVYAYNHGYRISEDGDLLSPKGKALVSRIRRIRHSHKGKNSIQRSRVFNFYIPDFGYTVALCHRLAAYQKFSNHILDKSLVVYHLNGNSLDNSLSNIGLGTLSDVRMATPEKTRLRSALIAGAARRKFNDTTVELIRADRSAGMKYLGICEKYAVSKSTLSYLLNDASY